MLVWGRALLALDLVDEGLEQFDGSHELWQTAEASYWRAVAHDRLGHHATAFSILEKMYDEEAACRAVGRSRPAANCTFVSVSRRSA